LILAPFAPVFAGDLSQGMEAARGILGWYIGGMGSKEKNFYNQLAQRYGYVEEALRVQELFLGGDKPGAIAATPDGFVDECSIIGDEARIRDRLAAFEATGVTELVVSFLAGDKETGVAMMETLAKANGRTALARGLFVVARAGGADAATGLAEDREARDARRLPRRR
jgi:hypothetical protein